MTQYGGCGLYCGMQVGNILGALSGPGYFQSTSIIRPYVEEYQPANGFHANIYYNLTPTTSSFYNTYRVGQVDGLGNILYHADFIATGGPVTPIGDAWLQDVWPIMYSQAEMQNADPDAACPSVSQQEFGTYGWQQGSDFNSKLKLLRSFPGQWTQWTDAGTYNPPADWPYTKGFYENFDMWAVWGA